MSEMLIGSVEERSSWKGISSFDEAKNLIDSGIMLKWAEMRTLKRNFSGDDQCRIIRYMTTRLCERADERLLSEILIENMLVWIANGASEPLIEAFLDQFFEEPGREEAARALVEISLTTEVTDNINDDVMFSTAVVLICEIGLAVFDFNRKNPGKFSGVNRILDHIATYLLSVSNYNSSCTRLSLLHYFGVTAGNKSDDALFNRVMGRFGHTTLDHLFCLLFQKKSEGIALKYLTENLPYVLEAGQESQRILHETFKSYMLKQPDRFALFLNTFVEELMESDSSTSVKRVMMQHLGALLNIVSDVNHKTLGREILVAIYKFEGESFREELMDQISAAPAMRPSFKDFLQKIRSATSIAEVMGAAAKFGGSKRGRRPSFSKVGHIGTMDQITFLGSAAVAKAS